VTLQVAEREGTLAEMCTVAALDVLFSTLGTLLPPDKVYIYIYTYIYIYIYIYI